MIRRVEVLALAAVRVERDGRTLREVVLDAAEEGLARGLAVVRAARVREWTRALAASSAHGDVCFCARCLAASGAAA